MVFQDKNCYNCTIFPEGTETFTGFQHRSRKWQVPFQAVMSSLMLLLQVIFIFKNFNELKRENRKDHEKMAY